MTAEWSFLLRYSESDRAPALLLELLPERLDALPVDVAIRLADPRRAPVPAQHHHQQQQRNSRETVSVHRFIFQSFAPLFQQSSGLLTSQRECERTRGERVGKPTYSTVWFFPGNQNSTSSMKPKVGDSYSTYKYLQSKKHTQKRLNKAFQLVSFSSSLIFQSFGRVYRQSSGLFTS